ncbi:MAG TPA: DUF1223 domain-containing protein [Alphaproteobacteria bacterium]
MHGRSQPRRLVLCLAALAAGFSAPAMAQEQPPVVVELYTSQGCNSCPPADALFGEIARQPGIVALGFHVDYWNYLGWHDPFSSKKFTYRQKEYAMSFRQTGVYTPQIVVQGRRGEVGSDRAAVMEAIAEARKAKPAATVAIEKLGGNRLRAVISAASGTKGAEIWLALFDRRHATKILRGENEGRTLTNVHVVREWRKLGTLEGEKAEFTLVAAGEQGEKRAGVAVVVQQPKAGPILGAAVAYTE